MSTTHQYQPRTASIGFYFLACTLVLLAIGCSDSGNGNPVSSLSNVMTVDVNATQSVRSPSESAQGLVRDTDKEYCESKNVGYVALTNDFRCESVQVDVDGAYFTTLEPGDGIVTFMSAEKHLVTFKHLKSGRIIRESQFLLKACQELTLSTGKDICARAVR